MLAWLDRQTLQLVVAIAFTFSAVSLTVVWRINRTVAGPRWWMAGAWLAIAGVLATPVCALLGWPRAVGVAANNVISPVVFLCALVGMARFRGRVLGRRDWVAIALGIAGLTVASVLLRDAAAPRHLVHDAVVITLLVALAATMVRGTQGAQRQVHLTAATLLLVPVVGFAARWVIAWRIADDIAMLAHPIQNVLGLMYLVFSVGWTYAATLVLYEQSQFTLHALALTDGLTGLPNRRALNETLAREASRSTRTGVGFAVLLLDLNRFKEVNDTLGHPVGDALLVEVAARLRACARESDVVARLGGDEFVALLHGVRDPAGLTEATARLRAALDGPARLLGHPVQVEISVGGALWPDDGTDAEAVLHAADVRMYADKGARRRRRAGDRAPSSGVA